jgi:hypothetical protein
MGMRRIFGGVVGLGLSCLLAIVVNGDSPSWVIAILVALVGVAAIGWFVIPSDKEAPMQPEHDQSATSAASTSGDHSPAVSASHTGEGDILIDQSVVHHYPSSSSEPLTFHGERLLGKPIPDLFKIFDEHTSLHAQRLVEPFIKRPVLLEGVVTEIDAMEDHIYMSLDVESPRYFHAIFEPTWLNRLAELNRGDKVKVIGLLAKIGLNSLTVADAELVD